MGGDGTTSDRVVAGIDRFEERFGSFPVNQTTIAVSAADYEAARDRAAAGEVVAYVRVRNGDGEVLHERGESPTLPRCTGAPAESIPTRIRESVRSATGVACEVTDVARVTIAGVRPADADGETVYHLVALVDAEYAGGTPNDAVWESGEAAIPDYV